jgi:thiosulfate dehydrogenase
VLNLNLVSVIQFPKCLKTTKVNESVKYKVHYLLFLTLLYSCFPDKHVGSVQPQQIIVTDTSKIPAGKTGDEIRYGRDLYARTAYFLGPEGKVMQLCGNKMNCKNCHLDVGTRLYSNNFLETYLKYPQYRPREGMVLTIEDRINNCFERPMNGKQLPYDSREMRAMVAYLRWLCEGKVVSYEEDTLHLGKIALLDRAASVSKGSIIFKNKCSQCHGLDGQGKFTENKETYIYPPLWGSQSYAQGSSMHRLITASRFVKWSMPYLEYQTAPQLSDEDVFDVVAFINCDSIHPRPYRPLANDCPDLENKPIDFPTGPFLDTFSEYQHKYGPFEPILNFYKNIRR